MAVSNNSSETAIKVENVSKNFVLPHEKTNSIKSGVINIFSKKNKTSETQHALRDISFDVKKGEFFGILGRNGSGKSTLLKILAEIYQPTKGSIKTAGKLVPFIELGVGFNPELTGRENVYLNGALLGFSRKEIDARYDDIVKFAELEKFMDQKLKNYSSGMQVRLAFSVATRAEAEILLVDEVLAVGDADFQRKCFNYFKSLKKLNKTVIFVTHDMGAVREYCDKAILINDGVITASGNAEDIAGKYLSLFNARVDGAGSRNDGRWGSGEVSLESVSPIISKDKLKLKISTKYHSDTEIQELVLAIDIYDIEGKLIAGTESNRISNQLPIITKDRQNIELEMENIFGGGTFSVTACLRLRDNVTVFDYWENAAIFDNTTESNNYFPIILPLSLTREKRNK